LIIPTFSLLHQNLSPEVFSPNFFLLTVQQSMTPMKNLENYDSEPDDKKISNQVDQIIDPKHPKHKRHYP